MSWKETIVEWFDGFGSLSLGAMSFTKAIIQPVPPDLLFLPMLVNAQGDPALVLWLWGVITITSVLGSVVGYYIGKKWGRALFSRFKAERHLEKIEALTEDHQNDVFTDYNRYQAFKYLWRLGKKDDVLQELYKAATFINFAIEKLEKDRGIAND